MPKAILSTAKCDVQRPLNSVPSQSLTQDVANVGPYRAHHLERLQMRCVHQYSDGSLAIFDGQRYLARFDAK
jgi:hypothetical protein